MTTSVLYAVAAVLIIGTGIYHFLAQRHLLRKVLAANVISTGVFLLIVAMADRLADRPVDVVPHAMVLTGIVVAVSTTALLLTFICVYHERTGETSLQEEEDL